MKALKTIITITLCLVFATSSYSQTSKKKSVFRDSLDNKLDFSNFLMNPKGFIPIIQPITEPALGNIGGVISPVFISPNKHPIEGQATPPDITTAFGGYTANNTWMVGALRMATISKYNLKYQVMMAYSSVNMDFYRTLPTIGEKTYTFNFKALPIFVSLLKEINTSGFFIGVEYLFLKNEVTPEFKFENLPEFIDNKSLKSTLSSPGLVLEFDNRDNIFTPDNGFLINTTYHFNADWTGSDYDFGNLEISALYYHQFTPKLVSGLRLGSEMQFNNAPFYTEPYINLRGVPKMRYQGKSTFLIETEQRFDFSTRWSLMGFGGLAKAVLENVSFNDAELVYNYGTGFRYLIARKFKIRMGIDVAWSNNDFGYYIIFGCAWNNRK
ncbi:BamA/TamA family outer membrane protein [Xanthomarina sp. F2636L]|uniref:BamA/TamA family outer membrane protein n=1 Tax=Xanthomarina sp. F2636L TaxID=2996018 RepID=UPI00225E2616|nr:BamA/TamA family outer membrane protein [Xanthomarina sp. F2636L]MCX7550064.1 BamA/TamA family outer membrane protein [Xanthomarina sp. F2636L]